MDTEQDDVQIHGGNVGTWTFSKLLLAPGKRQCGLFMKLMQEFLSNGEVHRRLAALRQFADDSRSFKHETRRGAVWIPQRRYVDLGNYYYSVIFLALHFYEWWTTNTMRFAPFMKQWTSLHPDAPETDKAYEMRGDVLEFILEFANETGPAVDTVIRSQRMDLNRIVRQMGMTLEEYDRLMFSSFWGGPPSVRQRPSANMYSLAILHACSIHFGPFVPIFVSDRFLNQPPWQSV